MLADKPTPTTKTPPDSCAQPPQKTPLAIDLGTHIPALCLALGSKVALHAKRHSAQQLGLDLSEWRIILVLGAKGRSTIFEIADCIAMDRGGTSRAISRMEKDNYLVRDSDPTDRRRSFVTLTKQGRELHEKIVRFALAREERLLQKLPSTDHAQLRDLLSTLIDEAEVMIEEQWIP